MFYSRKLITDQIIRKKVKMIWLKIDIVKMKELKKKSILFYLYSL